MPVGKSAPSYASFAFDVPEPQFFDGKFVYNYFMKDERVTPNVYSDTSRVLLHSPRSGPKVPSRKIVLEFTALNNVTNLAESYSSKDGGSPVLLTRTESEREKHLKNEANKILSEAGVQSERTTFVATQDDDLAAELQTIVDAELLLQKATERSLSPLEAVLKYNSITSDRISASDILETTDVESSTNLTYYDPATGEDISVQKQGGVSAYAIGGFYNKKFIYDILSAAENTPFSPLWGTISEILSEANRTQIEAVAVLDSNVASMSDYEYTVYPIDEEVDLVDGSYPNAVEICGYLIEKYEVQTDGTEKLIKIIPIAGISKTTFDDEGIIYGKTYKYSIKTVFYLSSVSSGGVPSGTVKYVTYLISSRGSPYIEVLCEEIVPPPPPENIQFYLSSEQELILFWSMPYNTQDDIKRFQIFRRSSLEDPYTIIKELDFDDSEILTSRAEFIPDYSKTASDYPKLDYTDCEFEFDTVYYYALCSVDAHDLSSSYSSQFKVSYNRVEGKMDTDLIAFAGSPKAYPNFTLKSTLTVDCIKDSGHSKMKIYFDPECIILNGAAETVEGGLTLTGTSYRTQENYIETNSGTYTGIPKPMYKLQIINLDRQQDQKVDIYLKRASDLERAIADLLPGD